VRISAEYVARVEHDCDHFNAGLPSLRSFVLPGRSSPASEIHVARAVCRKGLNGVADAPGPAWW